MLNIKLIAFKVAHSCNPDGSLCFVVVEEIAPIMKKTLKALRSRVGQR